MRLLILTLIFILILISFLATPAPQSLEIDDLLLIALPCILATLSMAVAPNYTLHQSEYSLFIAVLLYLSYLLVSILIALVEGVPILNILRSIGPYINFFPLLFLCILPWNFITVLSIGIILIVVGLVQASYQVYLYFSHAHLVSNTFDVLKGRITLIEPRTTLPFVLGLAILPLVFFSQAALTRKGVVLKLLMGSFILLGLFAGVVTLTRSIILAIFFGWLVFLILYLYQIAQKNSSQLIYLTMRLLLYLLLFGIFILFISVIPRIHLLEQGLWARFYSASASVATDYSNGRLYDEWLPALKTWLNSGIIGLFFGIGAGNSFIVTSGEERTYIHNLSIYSLVYGGLYGFFTCMFLYFATFKAFISKAIKLNQMIYIGFAALLASIFFYSQFFAIHKGLTFNAMLFLMIAIALRHESEEKYS
jgi:hypothetical protein